MIAWNRVVSRRSWQFDCRIQLLLALAFSDKAFHGLSSPSELYELKRLNTARVREIPWKHSIRNTSIMRQFNPKTGSNSPTQCLTYDAAYSQADELAFRAGFLEKFNFYGFRRGVANLIDKAGTEAQRNHLMNHSSSGTFHSTYVSKTCMDAQQVFLGLPERPDLSRLISRKAVLRDEHAPTELTKELAAEVKRSEPTFQKYEAFKSKLINKHGAVDRSPAADRAECKRLLATINIRVGTAREKRLHQYRRECFTAENLKTTGGLEPDEDSETFSSRLASYIRIPIRDVNPRDGLLIAKGLFSVSVDGGICAYRERAIYLVFRFPHPNQRGDQQGL